MSNRNSGRDGHDCAFIRPLGIVGRNGHGVPTIEVRVRDRRLRGSCDIVDRHRQANSPLTAVTSTRADRVQVPGVVARYGHVPSGIDVRVYHRGRCRTIDEVQRHGTRTGETLGSTASTDRQCQHRCRLRSVHVDVGTIHIGIDNRSGGEILHLVKRQRTGDPVRGCPRRCLQSGPTGNRVRRAPGTSCHDDIQGRQRLHSTDRRTSVRLNQIHRRGTGQAESGTASRNLSVPPLVRLAD